jgi:hypothetical protein
LALLDELGRSSRRLFLRKYEPQQTQSVASDAAEHLKHEHAARVVNPRMVVLAEDDVQGLERLGVDSSAVSVNRVVACSDFTRLSSDAL